MAFPSLSSSFSYDVFLSFRETDTRYGFTGHLYKALCDKGIHTFVDDKGIHTFVDDEEMAAELENVIQQSKIAIIVLSKDYASSSFCLDELSTIIHSAQSKGLLVIPVFYMVDPSDVRHQRGSYGDALAKHEKRLKHNMDKLQKWKQALRQVADLSGYHFKAGETYEYKFLESIVDRVSNEINRLGSLHVGDYLVGLESRVRKVMKLLDVGSNNVVHMVGIHGMGGIGKSTLARAVYNNLIAEKFDGSCYLENVREASSIRGLTHLQSILLQVILGDKNINVTSVVEGASMIAKRLQRKKVLLVLDDVDKLRQLEAIVGSPEWFGPGSRVIITTRDQHLLACHQVKIRYEVETLKYDDARQLLIWKAFKKEKTDPIYEELLNRILTYASGLPLALEVIGCNLFGKSVTEWEYAINRYTSISHTKIHDILKISFDALDDEERSVFLDIACCFNGYELGEVQDILSAHYGYSVATCINVLIEKSLAMLSHSIKPSYDTVILHNLIEDMGKAIVRQESPGEPGERSRLWSPEDIIHVLKHKKGTTECKIICMDFPEFDEKQIVEWDGNAFRDMRNLKILIIRNCNFSKGPEYLPNSLRVLEWSRYPSHCLPSDFHPERLAICKLPCSRISKIELTGLLKKFVNLRVLKFSSPNV